MEYYEVEELKGKTCSNIEELDDEIIFTLNNGDQYKLYHSQDCCENVIIEDVNGDWNDLIGSKLLVAEEVSNEDFEKKFQESFNQTNKYGSRVDKDGNYEPESYTWTFYKFATINGYVTVRWYGESNGYYSEGVDFAKKQKDGSWDNYHRD